MHDMTDQYGTLFRSFRFMRVHLVLLAALSALVMIPCFWHGRLEAGDLPSHTYNAWLSQLIEQGKAPGLYTVWQRTNVLFDVLLLYSTKRFGFVAGPKLAVAICVLVFFWGVFSFVAVASGRAPWFLTPLIAMLTYGYVFNMGFFNYYLSVGLASFGLALFWRARKWDWLAGALAFCLAVLAHPMGSLWCLAALAYVFIRRSLPGRWRLSLPAVVIGIFVAAHWYLANATNLEINWRDRPFYFFNGSDQLVVYTARSRWIASACLTIVGSWLAYELLEWRQYLAGWKRFSLLLELYLLSFCITCLLPQDIRPEAYSAWMGLLVNRLTIVTAIFALCALSCLRPRKLAAGALATCAVVFFLFLYQDTGVINRLERNAEQITAKFSYGTRVIPTIEAPDSRISYIEHVIDRACIGHCFIYSNYEPSSGQFRVRVRMGSAVTTASAVDAQEMEAGNYVVKPSDPPLINIYQCSPGDVSIPSDFTSLCMRNLAVGDTSGPHREEDSGK